MNGPPALLAGPSFGCGPHTLTKITMFPSRLWLVLLAIVTTFLASTTGDCQFPEKWMGDWFQSGKGNLHVNRTHFFGSCVEMGKSNRYLVYIAHEKCHKCMVITMKHFNVIQYKESYCNPTERDLTSLCMDITGDAALYSMFRLETKPVSCPFRGPLTFSYSKGYGDCKDPVSQIDSCADDSRLLFRQQACPDIPKSESKEEELVCLGSWKDGSNYYMVGKINHSHANTDEDRYRCFIYEGSRFHKHRRQDAIPELSEDDTFHLSMSADATCQGLITPHEGGKTMVLTKVHGSKKCKLPSWLSSSTRWHTLDESESYYLYHHNSSLKISNSTAPPENPEVRGHSDLRLVCHAYENSHGMRDRHKDRHTSHHKSHHDHADSVTIIAHFTVGCRSGYKCMRIYRRDENVVQVQFGQDALIAQEACKSFYWNSSKAELVTLVSQSETMASCGPHGRYHIPDAKQATCGSNVVEAQLSQPFTHLTVGCSKSNSLQLHAKCSKEVLHKYQCHGQWTLDDVTYVVASPLSRPSGAPRKVCFAYSFTPGRGAGGQTNLTFTARHDTCISSERDARMSLNATLIGQCTEPSGISSSGTTFRTRGRDSLVLKALLSTLLMLTSSRHTRISL